MSKRNKLTKLQQVLKELNKVMCDEKLSHNVKQRRKSNTITQMMINKSD